MRIDAMYSLREKRKREILWLREQFMFSSLPIPTLDLLTDGHEVTFAQIQLIFELFMDFSFFSPEDSRWHASRISPKGFSSISKKHKFSIFKMNWTDKYINRNNCLAAAATPSSIASSACVVVWELRDRSGSNMDIKMRMIVSIEFCENYNYKSLFDFVIKTSSHHLFRSSIRFFSVLSLALSLVLVFRSGTTLR